MMSVLRWFSPVEGWKSSWKWLSIQLPLLFAAWSVLPEERQIATLSAVGIPQDKAWAVWVVLFILGRLVSQSTAPRSE